MKTHNIHLDTEYFEYILNGTKRIELRLFDEKRRLINLNDIIIFEERNESSRTLKVKVIELIKEDNFNDLINKINIELLASKNMSKNELISKLNNIYSKEDQEKYGVVGIRFEIIK